MQHRGFFEVRDDKEGMSKDEKRNKEYLQFIFQHRPKVIEKTWKECRGVYPFAYDELVRARGHGTPGRTRIGMHGYGAPGGVRRGNIFVPPIAELPRAGTAEEPKGSHVLEQENWESNEGMRGSLNWKRERLRKACGHVDRFHNWQAAQHEFWSKEWGETYEGFLNVQRQLGVLRDEISDREWFGEEDEKLCGRDLTGLRRTLSFMLRHSAREWYKRWGELDLHRLCERDALKCISEVMKQPPWREMRIVAGQKRHAGDDHNSEGVLFDLIHRLFDGAASQRERSARSTNVPSPRVWAQFESEDTVITRRGRAAAERDCGGGGRQDGGGHQGGGGAIRRAGALLLQRGGGAPGQGTARGGAAEPGAQRGARRRRVAAADALVAGGRLASRAAGAVER
ncbi:splicing factor 3B subunit 4 [Gracilaria domingensis]|nr:splicing factor 3B subunit 4 [Gracilaria domingensis]